MRIRYTGIVPVELGDGRVIQPGDEFELGADPGRLDFEIVTGDEEPAADERPQRKGR